MDKKRNLESLRNDLFKDLPDQQLGRAAGGEIVSSAKKGSITNFGKIHDEEFAD